MTFSSRMTLLLNSLSALTLAIAGTLFLSGSSRILLRKLGTVAPTFTTFLPLMVFVLTTAGVLCYLWGKVFAAEENSTIAPSPIPLRISPATKGIVILQILLSLAVITRSLLQIQVPLDWDEHEHVSQLAGGDAWASMNPFRGSEVHSIAAMASFVSMKIFGPSKVAARIPAILFSVGFLIVLNLLFLRYASPVASIFCLATLAGNLMVIYMMHSMRGYAPMLCFSTLSLLFVLDFIAGRKIRLPAFALVTGIAIFCHSFAGLFTALLFTALLFWLYQNRKKLPAESLRLGNKMLAVQFFWLLVFASVSVFVLLHLRDTGFALPQGEVPAWVFEMAPYRLFSLFGLVRMWEIKLFLFLMLFLLGIRLLQPRTKATSFPVLLLVITTFSMLCLSQLLHIPLLEGRMLTPFLVIFLWWAGETIDQVSSKPLKRVLFVVALSLLVLPFHLHHDADDGVPEHFADHEKFAAKVYSIVSGFPDRCFSFSGDPAGVKYAANFYFLKERQITLQDDCAHHFHLFYGEGLFRAKYEWTPPKNAAFVQRLYDDDKGRVLFSLQNKAKRLTMKDSLATPARRSKD